MIHSMLAELRLLGCHMLPTRSTGAALGSDLTRI